MIINHFFNLLNKLKTERKNVPVHKSFPKQKRIKEKKKNDN